MFEEVLSRTLFELGLDLAQVNFIVQKRDEARAPTPGGSRSMRAGTKRGQQGNGWGYGKRGQQGHSWRSR